MPAAALQCRGRSQRWLSVLPHRQTAGPVMPVRPHTGLGPGVLAVAILLLAAAYGLFAQSAAHPAFQSVSIRPSAFNWSERSHHPVGLGADASLLLLIQFAYATHNAPYAGHIIPLPASQIVGGPPWIHAEGWDIVTKSLPADSKQYLQIWQTLLADRFKLRLHRETRELPIYVLSAAENGFKLPAPGNLGCVSFPAGTKPHQVPGKVDCGYISGPGSMFAGAAELGMRGRKLHMADLIAELAVILDRPISDHTGFTNEFDVDLNFAPDRALQGFGFGPGDPLAARPPADPNLPNIFAALEQQLGLKLAPAKGPVEVLVIDHAERPTAN